VKPPWGRITAIDLNQGEIAWQVPNADTPENVANNPLLEGVDVGRTGVMTRAVLLVTRNFLFAGEGTGGSPAFRAHDKQTGEILWETELPATATGVPMGYELNGQPYIVVAVAQGGGRPELVALTVRSGGGRGRGGGPGGFGGGGRGGGGGNQ
jgi:glucose dehydrogenase